MKENKTNKNMLANTRRLKILEFMQEDGSARVKTLSEIFSVTEPTVRQDLEQLERKGYIVREHGGAYLKSLSRQVNSLSLQHTENADKKRNIALTALRFITDGESLILDSGSTVTELAALLQGKKNLSIVTNALNIALLIGSNPGLQLLVTGGEFKPPTLSLTGEKAAGFLENVYVDKLFLAAGGISESLDITFPSFNDLPVKRAMIKAARTTYLLADSSKFGKASIASLGPLAQVDHVITDSGLPREFYEKICALGVKVVVSNE